MNEIPVYLFTGFMDSGKTSLIKDTLFEQVIAKRPGTIIPFFSLSGLYTSAKKETFLPSYFFGFSGQTEKRNYGSGTFRNDLLCGGCYLYRFQNEIRQGR